MWDHIGPLHTSQFGAQFQKKASFCRTEALEWRFGVHRATVRGPPKITQNETDLWTLNRLAYGPRTGFQIGHFGVFFGLPSFCLKPLFYSVFVQIPSTMLKCWAQLWSKFQTLKNQFERRLGRFVVPEPVLKMGPRNQTKKQHHQEINNTKTKRFFLQKEAFSDKKREVKNENFDGLGLLAFLWPKICNDNSGKTL